MLYMGSMMEIYWYQLSRPSAWGKWVKLLTEVNFFNNFLKFRIVMLMIPLNSRVKSSNLGTYPAWYQFSPSQYCWEQRTYHMVSEKMGKTQSCATSSNLSDVGASPFWTQLQLAAYFVCREREHCSLWPAQPPAPGVIKFLAPLWPLLTLGFRVIMSITILNFKNCCKNWLRSIYLFVCNKQTDNGHSISFSICNKGIVVKRMDVYSSLSSLGSYLPVLKGAQYFRC